MTDSFTSGGASNSSTAQDYAYDAAGNVRELKATYKAIGATSTTVQDNWFTYDSLNRVLISGGQLDTSGGTPVIDLAVDHGAQYTYDAAGDRASATTLVTDSSTQQDQADGTTYEVSGTDTHVETYGYTPAGYLSSVHITDDNLDGDYDGDSAAYTAATYVRDSLGRATTFAEYKTDGSTAYTSVTTYGFNDTKADEVDDTYAGTTDTRDTIYYAYDTSDDGSGPYVGQVTYEYDATRCSPAA